MIFIIYGKLVKYIKDDAMSVSIIINYDSLILKRIILLI